MEGALYPSTPETRVTLSSLPPEILGEIFVQCSSQHPDSPLLLRQVSKSFHAIVHGTPRAWEHLTLHHSEGTYEASSHKAQMWFRHSGSCFVDVRVEIEQRSTLKWGVGSACGATPSAKDALSSALAAHVDRIRTLNVLAPSEPDARSLLDALYANAPSPSTLPDVSPSTPTRLTPATQSISIRVSSTTPPNLRLSSLDAKFPSLPNLRSLKLTNHTISFLSSSAADLENLRELEIECPIRFQPIRVGEVMGILRRAGRLERLRLESRVVDDDEASPSPSPSASSQPPSPNTAYINTDGLDTAFNTTNLTPPDSEDHPPLVHLPFLTSLSLRTNAIPSLLSNLLLPNLALLKLEDLNSKRRGASRETASVLRQLLVRMELPNEYRTGRGLTILEMVGVDVQAQSGLAIGYPQEGVSQNIQQVKEDEDETWAWCFKRMVNLEEIAVSKTDVEPVLEVLAPAASPLSQASLRNTPIEPSPTHCDPSPALPFSTGTAQGPGDVDSACPRLRRCTLSTSTTVSPALVDRFREVRPGVEVKVDMVQDPFFQSLKTGPVDFLSMYCDSPRTGGLEGGVNLKNGATRRTGMRPPFGPWVVLA